MDQAVARKACCSLTLHTSSSSTSEKSSLECNPGSRTKDGGVLQAVKTFPSGSSSYQLWSHKTNAKPQRQLWFVPNKTGRGLLGLAGPAASPTSPRRRPHSADLAWLVGWAGCISAGCTSVRCRQGPASCCDARVQARCPFCTCPILLHTSQCTGI